MAKYSIADELVDTLYRAGIRRIYSVTGDSLNFVNDAVRRHGNIQWVHVRHEEAGAFAAAAEAELNGIACCAGSSGPGHVHLINGLYDAHRNNVPVIAIASACPSSQFGTDYFQETDPVKLFSDCSGYCEVANTPVQFSRMLHGALQHAFHRKEVAVIGLPGDLAASGSVNSPTTVDLLEGDSIFRPSDEELDHFADIINGTGKITIFCGIGAQDAHDEVIELASRIKAPVAYSFRGKMDIQYDNPYEIGMTGLLGLPAAYNSMQNSDLIILLGTDFPYENFMPSKTAIVQLDCRPERIGRRARVNRAFVGDVRDTLRALLPRLEQKKNGRFLSAQLNSYKKHREMFHDTAMKKGSKNRISPEYVSVLVDKYADHDAIFTVDTGMCCVWGARYITATGQRKMLGSFKHGSMANALPQAIGAALARPGQQVVAFCGDGGISMLLGDLATIMQYELPIKIFLFNNRSLGMVKLEMEVAGLPDWQTDMHNPDFAMIANAMGIKGTTVTDPGNVDKVIRDALREDGPVLVEFMTDPDALALPPKIEFNQVKGFATAMSKLILSGHEREVYDTARSNIKHLKEIF